jgi:hypothetical protein
MDIMKYLILIISIIAFTTGNAQTKSKPASTLNLGNVVSEPASLALEEVTAKMALLPISDSKHVIEIRLYSGIGFPGTQCTVITYDAKWNATKYKVNAKDSAVKTNLKPAVAIDKIAQAMIAANIFALPSQDKISTSNYKLDLATKRIQLAAFNMSDAPCYYIQFKVGDQLRQYRYCDPKAYAAFYKGQHEYADFVTILKQFAKLDIK